MIAVHSYSLILALPDGLRWASIDTIWFLPHLHTHNPHHADTMAGPQDGASATSPHCSKCHSAHMLSRDFIRADAERLERQLRPDEERMKRGPRCCLPKRIRGRSDAEYQVCFTKRDASPLQRCIAYITTHPAAHLFPPHWTYQKTNPSGPHLIAQRPHLLVGALRLRIPKRVVRMRSGWSHQEMALP